MPSTLDIRRVCVIGGDARADALRDVFRREGRDVVVSGGNAGIPGATAIRPEDIDADLFVISPEAPLCAGLADRLMQQKKLVLGPTEDGARLEGSKAFMKEVVSDAQVRTARYATLAEPRSARRFAHMLIEEFGACAIKTDGLAAGKGVLVTDDVDEADADIEDKLSGRSFGDAGKKLVIEAALKGRELSVFFVTDGQHVKLLRAYAQDYKRVGDGDTGANTGGMGCFSPVFVSPEDERQFILDAEAILAVLRMRGITYTGFFYFGYMGAPGDWSLLEINVRFGDPEAQVILSRILGGFTELVASAARGAIDPEHEVEFSSEAAVVVIIGAPGYPTNPVKGGRIIIKNREPENAHYYWASVEAGSSPDEMIMAGGRCLSVVGRGADIAAAREAAYTAVSEGLELPDGYTMRSDIALAA